VYLLAYPFTFCCLVTAKLLVLGRLTEFSKLKAHASSRWSMLGRALVGTIVVGNVVGLCCNIAGSIFMLKVADLYERVASENVSSTLFVNASSANLDTDFVYGFKLASAFFGFQAIILPLIVVAFVVLGAVSVRRIRAAMTAVQKAQLTSMLGATDIVGFGGARRASEASFISGRRLKRQILGTCGILFVSFSIRAAVSMMLAVGAVFGDSGNASRRCDNSNDRFAHMLMWNLYSPEIFFFATFLSQPVTLLVTLWAMTSGQTIAVMQANSLDSDS
jgi:Na+-translocating ferredoxin:NAD+ oxidoreductase RnfE subunit